MRTCFLRSSLMVNEDTPSSYLPDCTPGMMSSNFADCQSVFRPSLLATALNRSTSNPMTVLPSVSRNSLGAYDESVPMLIVPADLIDAGTFAASALSTELVTAGAPPPLELLPPQADMPAAIASTAIAASQWRGLPNELMSPPRSDARWSTYRRAAGQYSGDRCGAVALHCPSRPRIGRSLRGQATPRYASLTAGSRSSSAPVPLLTIRPVSSTYARCARD